ncbi:hypothetical protein ES708_10280 [subsurface metagenome]
MAYPGSLPVYNDLKIIDEHVTRGLIEADTTNPWLTEIVAICTELGTDVAGSASDLVTRLAISLNNAGKLKLFQTCTHATRPASPPEGMLIHETDTKDFFRCTVGGGTPTWVEIPTLADVIALLAAKANIASQPGWIVVSVKGIRGEYSGNVHVEIDRSENSDYSAPDVEVDSAVSQTGLYAHIGDNWVSFPAGGIPIDTEEIAYQATWDIGTRYYLRARLKHDSVYGEWYKTVGSGGTQRIGQGVRNYEDLFNKPVHSCGFMYISTAGTIAVTTGGTFEKAIGGTIAYTPGYLHNFLHSAGTLTYKGGAVGHFIVTTFVSIESGENAQVVKIRLAKNGTSIAGTEMTRDFTAQNRNSVLGTTWTLDLEPDDYVELFVTSDTNGDDVVFNNLTFNVRTV